ncbi:hypothetical protein PROVALCAL_03140 [Providencia alcalifaciens DSM 30120]|uniref:Uncharacterized protein n=1 Tax=Providencia alcalifaciens DSM 30120 TaxID=520999 RepID=B6XIF0_9GAMM|nr:hypothetical protein PROVALCAL_03140 [Providencia alcalifaciens DSM 30120]
MTAVDHYFLLGPLSYYLLLIVVDGINESHDVSEHWLIATTRNVHLEYDSNLGNTLAHWFDISHDKGLECQKTQVVQPSLTTRNINIKL